MVGEFMVNLKVMCRCQSRRRAIDRYVHCPLSCKISCLVIALLVESLLLCLLWGEAKDCVERTCFGLLWFFCMVGDNWLLVFVVVAPWALSQEIFGLFKPEETSRSNLWRISLRVYGLLSGLQQ